MITSGEVHVACACLHVGMFGEVNENHTRFTVISGEVMISN